MTHPIIEPRFSHASADTNKGTIRVAEMFCSRQGEGKLTGTESFFIRTSGCNLRCWFCDTPYASWSPSGRQLDLEEIIEAVVASGLEYVVITGGEPLLSPILSRLCLELRALGRHVTIETAGTVAREIECNLLSISPKFRSSAPNRTEHERWHRLHHQRRMPIETMQRLMERADDLQVKFVVDSSEDYSELIDTVRLLGVAREHVWVMPEGSTLEAMDTAKQWLGPWCGKQGFNYCERYQIRWYGNRRGT